jgi:DHA1 family tetracycline resistance protein-like MFS transporter
VPPSIRRLLPIYGVVFIDVLGFTTLIPLLPVLAAKYHASTSLMGAALSTSALFATLSSPMWGSLSDRYGRKLALQSSQLCSLVGYALIALSGNILSLFVARAISGLGGGNLGVAESYVADVTELQERERAFAWSSAAFGAGFVVGPVLAGQLLRINSSLPFWVAVGLEALNLTLTQVFISSKTSGGRKRSVDLLGILRTNVVLNLLARQFCYIFAYTYFFGIFSLYLERALGLRPEHSSLLLGFAGGVGALVLVVFADRVARRYGKERLVSGSFALALAAFVALPFARSVVTFIPVLIVWAAAGAALRPTLDALISQEAPQEARGAVLGVADALNNASMIVGPVAGGLVLERNPSLIGILPALCCAIALVLGIRRVGAADNASHGSAAA